VIINQQNLRAAFTGFQTIFNGAFTGVKPQYLQVAMETISTGRDERYPWMGNMPRIREWLGDRVVNNLNLYDFAIKNKSFESTIAVDRDDIEDDKLGLYTPMFQALGDSAAKFPDELVFALLQTGFNTNCYDGQFFFDTDHPVLDANGNPTSVSNYGGGAGTAWYLIDASRPIRPLIYQKRRPFDLTRMDQANDEAVFNRKEYRYGVDGRCNAGFGLGQLAYASKQALDSAGYATARAAMMGMPGDYGRPLGLNPTLLVVGPSLEGAARKLLLAETTATGATNEWKGTATPVVVPWLP
jgi:phage major head subunit gpT-like protein